MGDSVRLIRVQGNSARQHYPPPASGAGPVELVVRSLPLERTSSPDLAAEIWSAAQARGLSAFRSEPGPAVLDDHTPFLARGWRAVDIIHLGYPAWHTADETRDMVSAESLDQVGEALLAWLSQACLPLEG